jgi:type VI secretion system secreted protein VgrG
MSGPTQALRQIAINTPLGADVLLVRRCSIREEISRLFRIELNLSSKKSDINFDDIIGKNVTLRLELDNQTRYFNGFVSRFVQTKAERSYSAYQATVVPWLWFLTRTSDCRIFQESMNEPPDEMTVPGIIKKVFKDFGFENFVSDDGLSESYRKWEFCVQYRETAFNFVSRLMEQEGIGYYFKHEDGKHTLMLTDSINGHTPYENYETVPYHPHQQGAQDKEAVTDWVVEKELQPGVFAHNDYDFENPRQAKQKALVTQSAISRAHDMAEFQIYDYPGEFVEHDEGESLAKLRIQELQVRHETLEGEASALGLCAGYIFNLEDHPRGDQNREYLITSTAYEIDAGDFETSKGESGKQNWSCDFTAIPSDQPFRPARTTPKPLIQGVQTALVVGPSGDEIHTDDKARVKVQFHWDRYGNYDENSSCWIRVSHADAGKGWGSMITPRIDQEVIVEFLEGDPDRPIITGRVYNGDQTPPYADGQGVVSGMKSQTHQGSGFNEMSMDDTAGKEKITIHGQYDMNTTVEHDQADTIHNDRTITIDGKHTETIKKDTTIKVTEGNLDHDVAAGTAKFHVKGAVSETFDDKQETTVNGDIIITSKTTKIHVTASTEIKLEVGASKLLMKSDGSIELSGNNVAIKGSQTVQIKGASITSQADADNNTKGAIVLSEGSTSNTVKGGMVMLNP